MWQGIRKRRNEVTRMRLRKTGCGLPVVVVGRRLKRSGAGPHGPLVRDTVDVAGPVVPQMNRN